MIAFAMAKTSYSGEMVWNNQKVVLTIPGKELAEAVMGCGSTTGRNTDKIAKFGIELAKVDGSAVQIPVLVNFFAKMGQSALCGQEKN